MGPEKNDATPVRALIPTAAEMLKEVGCKHATDRRKWERAHNDEGTCPGPKLNVKQDEDDEYAYSNDDREPVPLFAKTVNRSTLLFVLEDPSQLQKH